MCNLVRKLNAMAFVLAALCISGTILANGAEIDLRLNVSRYDDTQSKVYVNVQVRYDEAGDITLGSQNYRFYYNSFALDLMESESSSRLNQSYSSLVFEASHKGIEAGQVNQLDFDDELGFANFSIALVNNKDGGIKLNRHNGWTTIATLVFDVLNVSDTYDIVWGRDGVTDRYATAFVQLGEWKSQTEEVSMDINFYGDLSMNHEELLEVTQGATYKVGPNPTTDFVRVTLDRQLSKDAQIIIIDLNGRSVLQEQLSAGQVDATLTTSELSSGTYMLQVVTESEILLTERIAVTR